MTDQASPRIPEGVIERLPAYLNILIQLRADGARTVSSARLGELTSVNPAQIRRDLTYFGSFGKRGVGYDIATLVERIQRILGSDHVHRLALVGAGNLGSAIAGYNGLKQHGFVVTAIFDADPDKIGTHIGDIVVQDVAEIEHTLKKQQIRIGVVAVPPEAAQGVTDELARAGVLGCDFAVLGPVRDTPSHPGVRTLGWHGFARAIEGTRLPVYALGGLAPADLAAAVDHGAHGIAMRRGAWDK